MAAYKMQCADDLTRCWHCCKAFKKGESAGVMHMPDESRRFVHEECAEAAVMAARQTDWAPAEARPPMALLQ